MVAMSSFIIVHCVAFVSLAFAANTTVQTYLGEALQYLEKVHAATKSHRDDVKFLQKVMDMDFLWMPILNETVMVEDPKPFFNQYVNKESQNELKKTFWPFREIKKLMKENTFAGADVRLAMDVFRSAMACSVLKHVSFQAFILHVLLTKYKSNLPVDEKQMFVRWMTNMVQVSMDKLTAMGHSLEHSLQPISKMRKYLTGLYLAVSEETVPDEYNAQGLQEIGKEMYADIERICVVLNKEEEGHYSALVEDLNRENRVKDLEAHRTLITETLKDATDIVDIETMHKYKGDIEIANNINPESINTISEDVMKRATAANYVTMNFLFLNLPIKTLSESQWFTMSRDKKTPILEVAEPSLPKSF